MQTFFESENINNYANIIYDEMWCAKLSYLADICQKLNVLSSSMKSRKENIIYTSDKIGCIKNKINLWFSSIKMMIFHDFLQSKKQ